MDITSIAVILSAISSLIAILTAGGTALYAFAVLRTEVNQAKVDIKLLWTHANNAEIHFNEKAFLEFERRIDERFSGIQKQIEEVKDYCEEIDKKVDSLK